MLDYLDERLELAVRLRDFARQLEDVSFRQEIANPMYGKRGPIDAVTVAVHIIEAAARKCELFTPCEERVDALKCQGPDQATIGFIEQVRRMQLGLLAVPGNILVTSDGVGSQGKGVQEVTKITVAKPTCVVQQVYNPERNRIDAIWEATRFMSGG